MPATSGSLKLRERGRSDPEDEAGAETRIVSFARPLRGPSIPVARTPSVVVGSFIRAQVSEKWLHEQTTAPRMGEGPFDRTSSGMIGCSRRMELARRIM